MEASNTQFINFETLGAMGIPFRKIMAYLLPSDAINFASTNKTIRYYSLIESRTLINIQEFGQFNMDLFPEYISTQEVDAVHRVFPYLRKLKINMTFAKDHFLDDISKFENLQKLSVWLDDFDVNYNLNGAPIRAVTCRMEYFTSNRDALYSLLWQIKRTKILSLYNGQISLQTMLLIETRELTTLKICNSIIDNIARLSQYLLHNTNLSHLKLASENYLVSPYPIVVANNFINGLTPDNTLNLKRFCFTMDQNWNIRYHNIKLLRNLTKLEIYYSVQHRGLNLDRLISIAGSLGSRIEVTFIEFIERYKIFNHDVFESTRRKSYFYRNIIESMDKYMEIKPINYQTLRGELDF